MPGDSYKTRIGVKDAAPEVEHGMWTILGSLYGTT